MMSRPSRSPWQRQLARTQRRLLLQGLFNYLSWGLAIGLLVAAIWFLADAFAPTPSTPNRRLAVVGVLLSISAAAASLLAAKRAPGRLATALMLDERFNLKERVTTSYTLTPSDAFGSAGRALLEDANQSVRDLDIGSRFPVSIRWSAGAAPLVAAALALTAFSYRHTAAPARDGKANPSALAPIDAKEIEQKISQLVKRPRERHEASRTKSEALMQVEAELEKIANRPVTTKDQLKERIKELTGLEDRMKDRERDFAERSRALKEQLQQMDRSATKGENREGPASDLQKALSQGNFHQANQEMERLAEKLQKNQLSAGEKEQLSRQLKTLQEKLERLAKQQDKADQLNRMHREGKLSEQALKQELQQLKQESEKLKDLQALAKKLAEAQKAIQQNKSDDAAKALGESGSKLKEMELDEQGADDLREQLKRLEEAKDALAQGAIGPPSDEPTPAWGRRPLADEQSTRSFETKVRGSFEKGKLIFDGYAPGTNFRKKTTADMAGEVRQASQEAPEAIEQQRIPKSARDMAKGYFRNLGGLPNSKTTAPPKP